MSHLGISCRMSKIGLCFDSYCRWCLGFILPPTLRVERIGLRAPVPPTASWKIPKEALGR